MTAARTDEPATAGRTLRTHYDALTIALHWLTALLTFGLFGMALWWDYAPRALRGGEEVVDVHVALGLLLAGVILVRLVWRLVGGVRFPHPHSGWQDLAARLVHWLLYMLIVAQIVLGVLLRWTQGGLVGVPGWFGLPPLLGRDHVLGRLFDTLHRLDAWAIVILAGGHAVMALVHHYLLRDGTLRRMLPGGR